MNRAKLGKIFAIGVVAVGLWLIYIVVYLFSRQKIIHDHDKVRCLQNQAPSGVGTHGELLDYLYVEDLERNDTFKGLNKHTWERYCQSSFEQLCNYPIFPKAPCKRSYVANVNIISTIDKVDGAVRLLGYIRPNTTGKYHFLLTSNDFAELWISPNTNWKEARKIAFTRNLRSPLNKLSFEAVRSQISNTMSLMARRKYYFEVIYVQSDHTTSRGELLIQVAWKRPDKSGFELIGGEFFSLYTEDSDKDKLKIYDEELPDVLACEHSRRRFANKYMRPETLPYLERAAVDKTLLLCDYRPSYVLDPANLPPNLKQDYGVMNVRKTYTYPFQSVSGVLRSGKVARTVRKTFLAEYPLNEKEALSVIRKYFNAVKNTYPSKYELQSINRVEKKEDPKKGSRYLLELVVKDLSNGTSYILAEYVFQPRAKNVHLCYPKGLQWNRAADVYLILTSKNLGRWVYHFIKNVEQIVQETKDEHLHVIIFDFDSPDIDLEQAFKKSSLKNYHFITQPGNYSRTISFTRAVESIKDPDAIIVTIDMHLDLGSQLISDIRKHCIKGKTLYAPQIVYLNCDGSSAIPTGHWYHYSYGTVAVYKEDWEKFGGFSKKFINKVTWGGEDWDIINGAVKGGLEIERKRSPAVYHYYHTKAGMWQEAKKTTKARVPEQAKKATKDGVPEQAKKATKDGVPDQAQKTTKDEVPEQAKKTTKDEVPEQAKKATKDGVPRQAKRATKTGLPQEAKRATKDGVPQETKRTTKDKVPRETKKATEAGESQEAKKS